MVTFKIYFSDTPQNYLRNVSEATVRKRWPDAFADEAKANGKSRVRSWTGREITIEREN